MSGLFFIGLALNFYVINQLEYRFSKYVHVELIAILRILYVCRKYDRPHEGLKKTSFNENRVHRTHINTKSTRIKIYIITVNERKSFR